MLNQGITEINNLNKEFYKKHNESFDNSRFMEWEGFLNTIKYIKNGSKILDIGCGNGRFLEFLLNKGVMFEEYLGIDNSQEFIQKNRLKFINHKFEFSDIVTEDFSKYAKFDILLIFGVTHHIPYEEYRKEWYQKISNLVSKDGYIVISFWNFNPKKSDSKFSPKIYKPEENDYFLGWKNKFDYHRFCHLFSKEELEDVISSLKNFEVIENFQKDQNTYLIFKKIN